MAALAGPGYIPAMDLESLSAAWQRRLARERQELLQRSTRARGAARRAAESLRRDFGAEEVWLFGSVVAGPRHDAFDVDLAVRGLAPERYYEALARVSDLIGGPVDLVPLESCGERLRGAVAATGERLDG